MATTSNPGPLSFGPSSTPTVGLGRVQPAASPNSLLTIGAVTFNEDEHPPTLEFGGSQQLAIHRLIGGGTLLQPLGVQIHPVTWQGNLWANLEGELTIAGVQSALRARQQGQPVIPPEAISLLRARVAALRTMLRSGSEQSLSWDQESYFVVVKELRVTYHSAWWAEYNITVVPSRDANGQYTLSPTTSIDQQMADLLTQANAAATQAALADPAGLIATQQALQNVGAAQQVATPISQNAQNTSALKTTISAALKLVSGYIGTIGTSAGFNPVPVIANAAGLGGVANSLVGANLLSQQSLMQTTSTALSLMQANLASGQSSQVITVPGGIRLDRIAAQYYGDASLAGAIAQINGLTSLRLPAGTETKLTLPPLQSNNPLTGP